MSSAPSVLRGTQEPRLASVPPFDESYGDLAIEYAASVGLHLDPWQQYVMINALGRRGGQWAAFEVDVTVGRQNGKGAILEARELSGIEVFGNKLIIHTAHELSTAEEAQLRMEQICESSPDLDRQVARVVRTNGKAAIEFKNGARIKYKARSKGGGRGFAGADMVVMDEKMILRAEPMAALLPTLATSPDPQVWYMGSAFFDDSTQQLALRERMLAGMDPELAAFEWSVEDGTDLDDREAWEQANPSPRISMRFLERERAALDDADFAREHLGIGGGGRSAAVIDPDVWASLADPESRPRAPYIIAIAVNPERSRSSLTVAARQRGNSKLVHVEITSRGGTMDYRPGTSWVVPRLVEMLDVREATVILDPSSPAGALLSELREAKIEPQLVSGNEYKQACGEFYDAAMGIGEGGPDPKLRQIVHLGQPALNVAIDAGRKRKVGDAWVWHPQDASVDITPLQGATLAFHGVRKPSTKRERTGHAVFV